MVHRDCVHQVLCILHCLVEDGSSEATYVSVMDEEKCHHFHQAPLITRAKTARSLLKCDTRPVRYWPTQGE